MIGGLVLRLKIRIEALELAVAELLEIHKRKTPFTLEDLRTVAKLNGEARLAEYIKNRPNVTK